MKPSMRIRESKLQGNTRQFFALQKLISQQSPISDIMQSGEDLKFDALAENELDQMKVFHEQAAQIIDTYFIRDGAFNASYVIQFNKINGELNTYLDGPNEANIRSMVLLVRPMTLAKNDKTKIRIDIVLDILINRSADNKTRLYLQTLLRNYNDRSSEPKITLCGPHGFRTQSDIVNFWVNGFYFHKDCTKRKELDDLMKWPPMQPVVKGILLNWIIDSCNWALLIDSILMDAGNGLQVEESINRSEMRQCDSNSGQEIEDVLNARDNGDKKCHKYLMQ